MVGQKGQLECANFDDEPEILASIQSVGKGVGLLFAYGWVDRQGDAFKAEKASGVKFRENVMLGRLTPIHHSQRLSHGRRVPGSLSAFGGKGNSGLLTWVTRTLSSVSRRYACADGSGGVCDMSGTRTRA